MSIYGLILAGGQSTRMKTDKSKIRYHDKNQLNHTYDLLKIELDEVYVSLKSSRNLDLPYITDKADIGGPMNGLLSACDFNEKVAWLVMAIDMPLVEQKHIKLLLESRKKSKAATCYIDQRGLPYPLLTIYEPKSHSRLKNCEYDSLSKFLIDHEIEEIVTHDKSFLTNANTPTDAINLHATIRRNRE